MNFHRMNPLDDPRIDAEEARVEYFDEHFPGWDTRDRFVDYADVAEPETTIVWGYGGDHRALIFGAYE